ncbi:MAG: TniQ family protein [Sterolibacterium sp.]|jgi:hypothetical protein
MNPFMELENEFDFSQAPAMPPRSVLFSLAPMGEGTAQQESLLSLIVRTSHAHAVSPRQLIARVFVEVEPTIAELVGSAFFRRAGGTVNGLGQYAEMFASAMEKLTGRQELRHLTMLPWKELFPRKGPALLSRYPRWCPVCLEQQRARGETTVFPLKWSLDLHKVCLIHQAPMEDRCSSCGKVQPFIPRYPDLAICDHCAQPLAESRFWHDRPGLESWAAEAVEGMVRRQSESGFSPSLERFRAFVAERVETLAAGNRAAVCQAIGFHDTGLNGWLTKHERPSITQLLAFCHGVNVMPADIFDGKLPRVAELPSGPTGRLKNRALCPRPTYTRRQEMKTLLEASLAAGDCRPMAAIAADLGVGPSCLRYWFPDFCRALSDRYRAAVKECAVASLYQRCLRVQEVVRQMQAEGEYPSRRRVNRVLRGERISLADIHVLEAYLKVLHQN